VDAQGRFVVTWRGYNQAGTYYQIFARRYDATGTPSGGEFEVDPQDTSQYYGEIAMDASGRFAVVWQNDLTTIEARRFDSDGTPLGPSFPVNTSTTLTLGNPRIGADPSGNFVVAWSRLEGTANYDVVARRFDSHGAPLGNEFPVNTHTTGSQIAKGVAAAANGFAVVWSGPGAGGPAVSARRYNAAGTPLTGELQVNQGSILFNPAEADVSMADDGRFVVAWDGRVGDTGLGVFARRYDAAGAPLSNEFPVNSNYTSGAQGSARVASDRHGNFLVSWTGSPSDGSSSGVLGHFFDRLGESTSEDFLVNSTTTSYQYSSQVALNAAGTFVVAWNSPDGDNSGTFARRSAARAAPSITVQPAVLGVANAVVEPGEQVAVRTAWQNESISPLPLAGTATDFSGPAGATYTLDIATADYGSIPPSASGSCTLVLGGCYVVSVSAPPTRPASHWDTRLQEATSMGVPHTWVLHVGESFADVPTDNIFYAFIETLFHNGVTGGCAGGGYCPTNPVTRAQMAVFLLKSKFGAAHVPPPCTGTVFPDVPCTGGIFDPWIEELAALQITGGCGGGLYCPNNAVTRQQMAVFLLKALEGSSYDPPNCSGVFADVPCAPGTGFSDWIEELYDRGITGGCSVTPLLYCPGNPNNRGQMAVFLVKTFGLVLYGG
jgi:hypothetical protein